MTRQSAEMPTSLSVLSVSTLQMNNASYLCMISCRGSCLLVDCYNCLHGGGRNRQRGGSEQRRSRRRSLSDVCVEDATSLKDVSNLRRMSGRKQTPGPERRPDNARGVR
jgi:hypothetical protein